MTAEEFRSIALSLPEALEDEHMGHSDFWVESVFDNIETKGSHARQSVGRLRSEMEVATVWRPWRLLGMLMQDEIDQVGRDENRRGKKGADLAIITAKESEADDDNGDS